MAYLHFLATDDGVMMVERSANGDWRGISTSLGAHPVTCASAREGAVIVGTRHGVFRSEDLGETWQLATTGLDIAHVRWLAHHPTVAGRMWAGTEPAGIFVSQDAGRSWQACPEVTALRDEHEWYLPYSPKAGCVRGFAFHGQRGYAAVEQGGLLRSEDLGETWHPVEGCNPDPRAEIPPHYVHPDVHSVVTHTASPDLVFAPTGGGFYRSDNGGRTWARLHGGYCRAVWCDPGDADHLILGAADGVDKQGRIEESADGGRTWHAASMGLDVPWPHHMVERFTQAGDTLLAVLSNGHLLAAPLKTLAWQRVLPQITDIHAVAVTLP